MHENKPTEVDPAEEAGEWLHTQLMESFGLETEAWAIERVARVRDSLLKQRPHAKPLAVEVLWTQEMTAFTAPGSYLYVSRELLQRMASDDPAALVIAHEMAHHDLGHLDLFAGRLAALRHIPGGVGAVASLRLMQRLWSGPTNEMEADAYALELCLAAGYDGAKCLTLFDILEAYAVDHGDLDIVYGPDSEASPPAPGLRGLLARVSTSAWHHARGYLSIRDRKEALQARLETVHMSRVDTASPD
jgi:predicted Zn-dependent protease